LVNISSIHKSVRLYDTFIAEQQYIDANLTTGIAMPAERQFAGFTLVEMMITVAIVAILAAVALPSYQKYVVRGKRTAAQAQMMDIANREQQYFLANRAYADYDTLNSQTGYTLPSEVSANYTPTIEPGKVLDASCAAVASATPSFVITLTATASGSQQGDGNLSLSSEGVKCPNGKWR
jgi:type IV pilus assembly protein PilE